MVQRKVQKCDYGTVEKQISETGGHGNIDYARKIATHSGNYRIWLTFQARER